ncbi:MAG: hypothetical protein HRT56_05390 [Coraliomargarita sp.]|nr:hypothetical protein [Coraliomargarita sp.]
MAANEKAKPDDFWDREALLADRENALFEKGEEIRKREERVVSEEASIDASLKDLAEREAIVHDRELTMRETEALLDARERVLNSGVQLNEASHIESLQAEALKKIQDEFDRRESELRAAEQALKEREAYIEECENLLSDQGQRLQEEEARIEQMTEDAARQQFDSAS